MTKSGDRFDREQFRQHVHTGEHGELLFDAPVEIKTKADLDNYGITWRDTKTIRFGKSESINVYYVRTENRAFADDQWRYLSTKHSSEYSATRCFIEGTRKNYIRCPGWIPCRNCPHKDDRLPPFVSLEALEGTSYEPATEISTEEQACSKSEYWSIREAMEAEDPRILKAFEMRELYGFTVKEIAAKLHVSVPRTYQLIAKAKEIGREYRERNDR